jgi:protein gp37
MSDLFHEDVLMDFLSSVFKTMNDCPKHSFQVLTKRSDVLLRKSTQLTWSDNIWMGVSVENASYLNRVDDLRKVPATIRFLSLEPLLGPLPDLDLTDIHWVIVGGESGKNHRPMDENWVREIRDKCIAANVPFYFKQWSGTRPKSLGRLVDGVEWSQFP